LLTTDTRGSTLNSLMTNFQLLTEEYIYGKLYTHTDIQFTYYMSM